MVFEEHDWRIGVEGVDEEIIRQVKLATLNVSFYLPSAATEEDLLVYRPYLEDLERALVQLRQHSQKPGAFPSPTCHSAALALWAIGLAQYLRTSR